LVCNMIGIKVRKHNYFLYYINNGTKYVTYYIDGPTGGGCKCFLSI